MAGYPNYHYSIPPPPPPPVNVAPNMADFVYEIAVPPSPSGSPPNRGAAAKSPYIVYGGDDRGKNYHDGRLGVGRSSSTKEHRRSASVHVGDSRDRRDRSRPRSYYHGTGGHGPRYEYDDNRGRTDKVYYGRDEFYDESAYSGSSQGSREHSRERYGGRHYRTPSAHSEMGDNYYGAPYPSGHAPPAVWGPPPPPQPMPGQNMALAPFNPPPHHPQQQPLITPGQMVPWQVPPVISPEQQELNKKIAELQLELKKSKEESEKLEKTKAQAEAEKKKQQDLQDAVKRELEARAAAEKAAADKAAAEKARIEAEAKKLLEEQRAAAEAAKKKEEDEKKKLDALVAEKLAEKNNMLLDLRKPTHTKFSKTHLCKEALDERKISYTEHEDSFLVHRWVDRDEQNQLWARTKQIRAYQLEYQKRFKEEADKAPVIDTPAGPVKIVRVGNNPPVTVPVVLVTKKAPVAEEVKFRNIFSLGK